MAMTPQERNEFKKMKKELENIKKVTDVSFIQSLQRRLVLDMSLSDLNDVSGTDSASTGQVLKKTSGDWQPGTDNTI